MRKVFRNTIGKLGIMQVRKVEIFYCVDLNYHSSNPKRNTGHSDKATTLSRDKWCLQGQTGSAVHDRYIAPWLKFRPDYVRKVFHLSPQLITFGSHLANLAYHMHKSDSILTCNK